MILLKAIVTEYARNVVDPEVLMDVVEDERSAIDRVRVIDRAYAYAYVCS